MFGIFLLFFCFFLLGLFSMLFLLCCGVGVYVWWGCDFFFCAFLFCFGVLFVGWAFWFCGLVLFFCVLRLCWFLVGVVMLVLVVF